MMKASETAERKDTIYTQKIGMNLLIKKKSTASGEEVSAGFRPLPDRIRPHHCSWDRL